MVDAVTSPFIFSQFKKSYLSKMLLIIAIIIFARGRKVKVYCYHNFM